MGEEEKGKINLDDYDDNGLLKNEFDDWESVDRTESMVMPPKKLTK